MKKFIIVTLLFCLGTGIASAQDPIFTQYFMVPQTINPAFTGFMEPPPLG